jgi:hypothetical protein
MGKDKKSDSRSYGKVGGGSLKIKGVDLKKHK